MRNLLIALLSVCLPASALAFPTAAPGYTTIMASNVADAAGNALASGTASFQVMDANGHPMSVQRGGLGAGQVMVSQASVAVVNGAFVAQVVDVSQTVPSFPCVALTITDNSTGNVVWQDNCLQPTGATYDLDLFSTSTTPVYPTAGDTVQGNLGVNGNLSVTGNLNMGGLGVGNLSATFLSSQYTNGVLNASLFAGADIGAKVNAAYATCTATNAYNADTPNACRVYIPAGVYTYSTDIVMPNSPLTTLQFDAGAVLKYTGSGYAVNMTKSGGNWGGGHYQGNFRIYGPGQLLGTSAAKAGIIMYGTNGTVISDIGIDGFSQGDGILNAGLNSYTIAECKISGNLVGIHLAAAPAAASNNGHIRHNQIINNTWGVIDGDMSIFPAGWLGLKNTSGSLLAAGVSSPNYGNRFESNDIENNTAGAVMLGLTVGDSFEGNYIEGNPRGIVIGDVETSLLGSAAYTRLYGRTSTDGGTSRGTSVTENYFTTSGIHSLVELRAADHPVIDSNGGDGSGSTCGVDIYTTTEPKVGTSGWAGVANQVCQGGSGLLNYANTTDFGINSAGLIQGYTGQTTLLTGTSNIVAQFGALTLYASQTDPGGSCGVGSGITSVGLYVTPDGIYICQGTFGSPGVWTKH